MLPAEQVVILCALFESKALAQDYCITLFSVL